MQVNVFCFDGWLIVDGILYVCFFYLPVDDGGKPTGSQLTVDDLFQKDFQIHDPDAKWINSKYVRGFGKSCLSHELSIH